MSSPEPPLGSAWLTAAMLFAFMLINFADKAVLGLSAVPVMRDLGLDHTRFGMIGTSFFAFFSMAAVGAGFLVNWVSTKWVLAGMALIWSLCQLPMFLAVGIPAIIANRVVLGFGEGAAYPVALHAAYSWFPDDRRPLPTSLIAIGAAVGTGIVAPIVVYVILTYSWHAAFGLLGVAGLVWAVVWVLFGREGPLVTNSEGDTGALGSGRRVPVRSAPDEPDIYRVRNNGFLGVLAIDDRPGLAPGLSGEGPRLLADTGRLDRRSAAALPNHPDAKHLQNIGNLEGGRSLEQTLSRARLRGISPSRGIHDDASDAFTVASSDRPLHVSCVLRRKCDFLPGSRHGC